MSCMISVINIIFFATIFLAPNWNIQPLSKCSHIDCTDLEARLTPPAPLSPFYFYFIFYPKIFCIPAHKYLSFFFVGHKRGPVRQSKPLPFIGLPCPGGRGPIHINVHPPSDPPHSHPLPSPICLSKGVSFRLHPHVPPLSASSVRAYASNVRQRARLMRPKGIFPRFLNKKCDRMYVLDLRVLAFRYRQPSARIAYVMTKLTHT